MFLIEEMVCRGRGVHGNSVLAASFSVNLNLPYNIKSINFFFKDEGLVSEFQAAARPLQSGHRGVYGNHCPRGSVLAPRPLRPLSLLDPEACVLSPSIHSQNLHLITAPECPTSLWQSAELITLLLPTIGLLNCT